jgi:cation diffusion facilitator CzcD-associated flavoprotein CzcO
MADAPRVAIVGAGPAGLATSRELKRRAVSHVVLERGDVGHTWNHLYDSLTLHTGKHLSNLPGLRFARGVPIFPHRTDFLAYLRDYRRSFDLPVETDMPVTGITPPSRPDAPWTLSTPHGDIVTDAVVVATGIVANPVVPDIPGRELFAGEVFHSVHYLRPAPFAGRRVLVVGVGNSAGEIASELAAVADVAISVRSGANVVPLRLLGLPIQYVAASLRMLPVPARRAVAAAVGRITELRRGPPILPRPDYGPLDAIPLIGFHLVDAIRAGRIRVFPGISAFTESGAHFTDGSEANFDVVILATGFRPALQPLEGHVRMDAKGFALRSDRVTSADHPRLFFVGHNYDSTGGLRNIFRDSRIVGSRLQPARPQS